MFARDSASVMPCIPLTHLSPQCTLGHVEPSRISNKKYDAELLHPVTQSALQAQGIPEAYTWLEACVAESDIAVGRALESAKAQGTLGRLHEVGAGMRVAAVHVMEPSIHLGDSNLFWSLPVDALPPPVQQDYGRPLPRVRYKEPQNVPIDLVASVPDDSDDERPLIVLKRPRRQALKRSARKRPKAKQADESALTVDGVRAGRFVVTHDNFGTDDNPQPGFSVCKIVGACKGKPSDPSWSFKHLLSSTPPHLQTVVSAKFGLGKGAVVDSLPGEVIHFYTIVAAFDGLTRRSQLPAEMIAVIKQHRDWAALQ